MKLSTILIIASIFITMGCGAKIGLYIPSNEDDSGADYKPHLPDSPEINDGGEDSHSEECDLPNSKSYSWTDYKKTIFEANIVDVSNLCYSGRHWVATMTDDHKNLVVAYYDQKLNNVVLRDHFNGKSFNAWASSLKCLEDGDFLIGANDSQRATVIYHDHNFGFSETSSDVLPKEKWLIMDLWGTSSNDFWYAYQVNGASGVKHFTLKGDSPKSENIEWEDGFLVQRVWGLDNNNLYCIGSQKNDPRGELFHFQNGEWVQVPLEIGKNQILDFITGTTPCNVKLGGESLFGQKVSKDTFQVFVLAGGVLEDAVVFNQNDTFIITSDSVLHSAKNGLVSQGKLIDPDSHKVAKGFKKIDKPQGVNEYSILGYREGAYVLTVGFK